MWRNTLQRYGRLAKSLHWGIGGTMLLVLLLGWVGHDLPHWLHPFAFHKTLGLWVMLLGFVWWASLLVQIKVQPVGNTARPLLRLATLVKIALGLLVVAMPLSGYAMVSAGRGHFQPLLPFISQTTFGLPPILQPNPDLRRALFGLHVLLSWIVTGVVGLHIAAALWHHFVKRDLVLQRMWPFALRRSGETTAHRPHANVLRHTEARYARRLRFDWRRPQK